VFFYSIGALTLVSAIIREALMEVLKRQGRR
jgi:hypothetical protein